MVKIPIRTYCRVGRFQSCSKIKWVLEDHMTLIHVGHSYLQRGFFMSQNHTLSKLSSDIFVLVRNGIYSLYEIEGQGNEKFLLVTNERRNIILSQDGEVIREAESLTGLRLKKATVEKAQASQYSVKLNYA